MLLHRYAENLAFVCMLEGTGDKLALEITDDASLNPTLLNDPKKSDPLIEVLSPRQKKALLKILRSGCLLHCDSMSFRFFHKTLAEYFVERHMVNDLVDALDMTTQTLGGKAEADRPLSKGDRSRLKALFLNRVSVTEEPNLLNFLAEESLYNVAFENQLVEILLRSKADASVERAAANAITILNKTHYPLRDLDLAGIRIPGADLTDAILDKVNLSGACLRGVKLSGAYLNGTNMSGTNLQAAQWSDLSEVSFSGTVHDMVFDLSGKILYVAYGEGCIDALNTQSWQTEQRSHHSYIPWWTPESKQITTLCIDGHPVINPHSRCLASSTKGGTIYLWQLPALTHTDTFNKHVGDIHAMAFNPTTTLLAATTGDKVIIQPVQGNQTFDPLLCSEYQVTALCFSPAGDLLAACTDDKTRLLTINATKPTVSKVLEGNPRFYYFQTKQWASDSDTANADLLRQVEALHQTKYDLGALILSPGCRYRHNVVKTSQTNRQGIIQLTDHNGVKQRILVLPKRPATIAYSPNARQYALCEQESYPLFEGGSTVHFSDLDRSNFASSSDDKNHVAGRVEFITLSPTGETFTILMHNSDAGEVGLQIWDSSTGGCIHKLANSTFAVVATYSHDGTLLVSASRKALHISASRNVIRIWSVREGILLRQLPLSFTPASLALSSSDIKITIAALGKRSDKLALFDERTDQQLTTLLHHPITAPLLFSPNGKEMAATSTKNGGTILLFNPKSKDQPRDLTTKESFFVDTKVPYAFSKDGKRFAAVLGRRRRENFVYLWDTATREVLQRIPYSRGWQDCIPTTIWADIPPNIALNEDGTLVAAGDAVWEVSTKRLIALQLAGNNSHTLFTETHRLHTLHFNNDFRAQFNDRYTEWVCTGTELNLSVYDVSSAKPPHSTGRLVWVMPQRAYGSLTLSESYGITRERYAFLNSQGATGKPRQFSTADSDRDLAEEQQKLSALQRFTDTTLRNAPTIATKQIPSLFPGKRRLNISQELWQVTLFRVSNAQNLTTNNTASSATRGSRHVYGLFEGLDAVGRRVWIRVDFVTDGVHSFLDTVAALYSVYGKVVSMHNVAETDSDRNSKQAFLALFGHSETLGTPYELTYHEMGCIPTSSVVQVLDAIMTDQQKQYCKPSDAPKERLRYRLSGGGNHLDGAHNCLTWLEAHFQPYAALRMPPKPFTTRFFSDPEAILSHKECTVMDIRDWDQSNIQAPVAAAAQNEEVSARYRQATPPPHP